MYCFITIQLLSTPTLKKKFLQTMTVLGFLPIQIDIFRGIIEETVNFSAFIQVQPVKQP